MRPCGNRLSLLAAAAAMLAYQFALHKLTTSGQFTPGVLLLALLPFIAAAVWGGIAELGIALTLSLIAFLAVLAWAAASFFGLPNAAFALGLPHLSANLLLLWFFARTLRSGQEPLITSLARRLSRTELTPELERYTRRVTLAWSVFFALQIATSLALYLAGQLTAWSTFINILNGPSIALMFVAEYGYRMLRFRDIEHSSLLAGLDVFARNPVPVKSSRGR